MDYEVIRIDLRYGPKTYPEGSTISLDPEVGDKIRWLKKIPGQNPDPAGAAPEPETAAPDEPGPAPAAEPVETKETKRPRKGGKKTCIPKNPS